MKKRLFGVLVTLALLGCEVSAGQASATPAGESREKIPLAAYGRGLKRTAIPEAVERKYRDAVLTMASRKQRALPNHYVVTFREKSFPFEIRDAATREYFWLDPDGSTLGERAAALVQRHGGELTHVLHCGAGAFGAFLTETAAQQLRQSPAIAEVAINSCGSFSTATSWGIDRINQRLGTDGNAASVASGAGVHLYIVDSGIRATHQEFTGRISTGFCPIAGFSPFSDSYGHGTHVAGIAAGTTYGVAPAATIHSVRIGIQNSSELLPHADVLTALIWLRENLQLPAVLNCSWATEDTNNARAVFRDLINAGATCITAAGNASVSLPLGAPSTIPEVVVVGATAPGDVRASFSNYGDYIDLWAPGDGITSAYNASDTDSKVLGGTSMASPHVAGAAALYLERNPTATHTEVRQSLVANATRDTVTGQTGGCLSGLLYTGADWINFNQIICKESSGPDGGVLLATDVPQSNGGSCDQVLMNHHTVRVHADRGQVTRVSWIDENMDIVMAEFAGCGNLRITLEDYTGPTQYPAYYNQSIAYVKGRATFTVEGPTENTFLNVRSLGTANVANPALFVLPSSSYDGKADIKAVDFWKSSLGSEIVKMGGILTGNCVYRGNSGVVGIDALALPTLQIINRVVLLDLRASNTAIPYLRFGASSPLNSDGDRVRIAGGALVQPNGSRILTTASDPTPGFSQLYTTANYDSHNRLLVAQPLSGAKFARDTEWNPIVFQYECTDHQGFPVPASTTSP